MNIQEDYVSFEIAKLLKEKGFDEQTVRCYNLKKELCACQCIGDETINSTPNYLIAAPTHQMACKWLREEYNIIISIAPQKDKYNFTPWQLWDSRWVNTKAILPLYDTYEGACEAAIKYCLKHLI